MNSKNKVESEKRVYTVDEITEILSVSKNIAYELLDSNEFHYVKLGKIYRISKKSFDLWLDGRKGGVS